MTDGLETSAKKEAAYITFCEDCKDKLISSLKRALINYSKTKKSPFCFHVDF